MSPRPGEWGGGCPVERWDGPYRFVCGLGGSRGTCAVHGVFADPPAEAGTGVNRGPQDSQAGAIVVIADYVEFLREERDKLTTEVDALRARVSAPKPPSDPGAALGVGDALQSAASRMAEWINDHGFEYADTITGDGVPYEVTAAALEAQRLVDAWTEARRGS